MSDDVEVSEAVDKLMGIKTYEVQASETVYYAVTIKASSIEEAWEMVHRGVDLPYDSIYDGDNFTIDDVVEVTE